MYIFSKLYFKFKKIGQNSFFKIPIFFTLALTEKSCTLKKCLALVN